MENLSFATVVLGCIYLGVAFCFFVTSMAHDDPLWVAIVMAVLWLPLLVLALGFKAVNFL